MYLTTDKIKDIQKAVGTLPDGKPGDSTWDNFWKYFNSVGLINIDFPYESKQFGCYVITSNKCTPFKTKANVGAYAYSMSGSFTYPSGTNPISILVRNDEIISSVACHYWTLGKPETVLYLTNDGSYHMSLCHTANDLPKGVKWAVGGGSMIENGQPMFKFKEEGFVGNYSDVQRTTAHCALGFDKYGNILGVYHKYCSLSSFQTKCLSLGMVDGIFLDGGHISAINTPTLKANTNQRQGYMIQF